MHSFQINAFILFLTSSTCFKTHGLIFRKTDGTYSFCMVCFSCIYVSSLALFHLLDCLHKCMKSYHTKKKKKLHVHTVCLMMSPWVSKHVEDISNWIKALIWKVCISLVYVAKLYQNAGCKKRKILLNCWPNFYFA